MKKLFTLMVSVLGVFTMNAQEWNFSDAAWASATVVKGTTVNGLTNYSANDKASIGASNKNYTLDGLDYVFTSTFKFGETGSFDADVATTPKTGVLSFEVAGNASISVIGTHASSSGDARELVVAAKDGSELKEIGFFKVYQKSDATAPAGLAGNLVGQTFTYTGAATTIFVYSRVGGVNLYLVKSVSATTNISNPTAAKAIKSVKYFDLLGKQVSEDAQGIIIVKKIYEDGSIASEKIFK